MLVSISRALVIAIPLIALSIKGGVAVEVQMGVAVMVAVAVVIAAIAGPPIPSTGWVLRRAALIAGFLSLYILLQAHIPAMSSHASDIWAAASEITGHDTSFISLAPADTIASVVAVTNPILLFCCGLLACRDDQSARWMIDRLATGGGLIVFGAVILFLIEPNALLIWEREHYFGSFTATFVNRNTAATFIGLVTLLLVAQIIRRTDRQSISGIYRWLSGERLGSRLWRNIGLTGLDVILCMACVMGLALTLSRAGIASSVLAMACLLCLSPWLWSEHARVSSQRGRRKLMRWLVPFAGVAVVLALASMLTGHAQIRLAAGIADDARFCIYPAIVQAIRDNWIFGTGFGAFRQSFAAYQPASCGLDGIWERAHNFYLEGMLGLGVVFLPMLFMAIWTLTRAFFVGMRQRQREKIYPAVGLAAMILILSHSMVDFSLQIPGFSLYLAAILAPLVVLSLGRDKSNAQGRRGEVGRSDALL